MSLFARRTPPATPAVRRLSPGHRHGASAVGEECYERFDDRAFRRVAASDGAVLVGSFSADGWLVGYALAQSTGFAYYLRQVAVLPAYRGQGHGRALLEALGREAAAGRHDAGNTSVSECDLAAQLFLRACGWRYFATQEVGGDVPARYLFKRPWPAAPGAGQ